MPSGWAGGAAPGFRRNPWSEGRLFQCPRGGRGALRLICPSSSRIGTDRFQCPRGGRGALRRGIGCVPCVGMESVSMPSGWAGGAAPGSLSRPARRRSVKFQCPRGGRGALRLPGPSPRKKTHTPFQCPRGGRGALRRGADPSGHVPHCWVSMPSGWAGGAAPVPGRMATTARCCFNALGVGGGRCASTWPPTWWAGRSFNALGVGGGRCAST